MLQIHCKVVASRVRLCEWSITEKLAHSRAMQRALQSQNLSKLVISQGKQLIAAQNWTPQTLLTGQTLPLLTAAIHTSAITSAGFAPSLNTPVDPSFLQRRLPPSNYGVRHVNWVRHVPHVLGQMSAYCCCAGLSLKRLPML